MRHRHSLPRQARGARGGPRDGLSEDTVAALSSQIWGWGNGSIAETRLREIGLDPADPRLRRTMALIEEIQGFPRHLSQHVGGFVITRGGSTKLVPVENATMEDRTVICWDKDDIDALGILKVDVLALGMLTCLRKAFELIERHHGTRLDLATLPPEDPAVYDMLCRADSLGVFQVESRAQMNFLPRMRPRSFYDLVIQVAIIRPGPIQGDMVHPYLRRRNGEEAVRFPSDALGAVLGKTLGVPLFQEQAMQIAITGQASRPKRPTACAARSPPSRSTAMSASSGAGSCAGWPPTAMRPISPNAAFPRSRASAPTASPKATRRASRCWSTPRPG